MASDRWAMDLIVSRGSGVPPLMNRIASGSCRIRANSSK
jgi:hypothetical protein